MSEALDEKDLRIFRELVKSSANYDYDLNTQYGPEVGFKTILHLALEEEDGFPYVEELLSVRFFPTMLTSSNNQFSESRIFTTKFLF